jgi:hypothetical protein
MEPVTPAADETETEAPLAEDFPYPVQSSYSAMIDAITGGAWSEWAEEREETE